MSETATKLNVDQLVGAEHFRPLEQEMSTKLARIRTVTENVNIYRPLKAWKILKGASIDMSSLKPQVDRWLSACALSLGQLDVTTMGNVVVAPVIMLSIHMRASDKLHEYSDLHSQLNTLKAFAFGVFALYVSLFSVFATLILGIMPFILKQ